MWSFAVWKEGQKEYEGVVAGIWIDRDGGFVYYPCSKNVTKLIHSCAQPKDTWQKFVLKKVKISSSELSM